jgi:flagellar basal body-associated protein FliL
MKGQSDKSKAILLAVVVVLAVVAAGYSAYRSFAPQEKVIGSLGTISRDAEAGQSQPPVPVSSGGKEAEMAGGDAASGAPAEAAIPAEQREGQEGGLSGDRMSDK